MPAGTPIALATLRVPQGEPRPADEILRQAVERDRARLKLPVANGQLDITVAGPYPVTVDGRDLDEYVVWER